MDDEGSRRSERFDERGLADKTRATYEERADKLDLPSELPDDEEEREAVLSDMRARLAERFRSVPLGTALPERAVAWHHLVAVLGLDEDAAKKWLPKLRKVDASAPPAPSDEQWKALIDALTDAPLAQRPLGRRALLLIAETGLRATEACGLKWKNVVEDGDAYLLEFEGKGGKKRTVPVPGRSSEMLRALPRVGDFVFSASGTSGIHTNTVRKELKRLGSLDGYLKGLKPHTLRHWFGTDALESGVDLLALQSLMGHASPETTKRYAQPSTRHLKAGMKKLERGRRDRVEGEE